MAARVRRRCAARPGPASRRISCAAPSWLFATKVTIPLCC